MTRVMNMAKRKPDNWDKYRAREAIAKSGGNYRSWDGGKGDIDRSTHTRPYQLGMELIKVADEFGKDSPEYKKTYDAWREAIKRQY